MADENKPIPAMAVTALNLLAADFNRQVQILAAQTLDVMGLSVEEWQVDFSRNEAVRREKA